MGVSGSGKSTIGKLLADRLNLRFYDGDDFHPKENVSKMASGIPLNDADRKPWLLAINRFASKHNDGGMVIACSALKQSYRDLLQDGLSCTFVFLEGSADLIFGRMKLRKNHFMPISLLKSQLETLEKPSDAIVVSIDQTSEDVVTEVIRNL